MRGQPRPLHDGGDRAAVPERLHLAAAQGAGAGRAGLPAAEGPAEGG